MSSSTSQYYLGIDVGTGSARASILSSSGSVIASSSHPTITFRDPSDHRIFEQSTSDIWAAICISIKACLASSGVSSNDVAGVGFDATCSLAVVDSAGRGIQVTRGEGLGKEGERNIVLWADHRAEKEADLINATGSRVLDYVGGTMSLEMEIPKILHLKAHMPPTLFARCHFFDLPDYLTYRSTGVRTRSVCSLTCKCSYVPNSGWDAAFFKQIGLGDLVESNYEQIGAADSKGLLTAGRPVGKGLSREAAEEMGLKEGTPVGSGLIDAYAGWLGTVAARCPDSGSEDVVPSLESSRHRLAAVAGTSTCHLVQSPAPEGVFVNGVWGPYRDAVFQGWWMNEGGQSSTGQLIDFILTTHPAYSELVEKGKVEGKNIHVVLQDLLESLRAEAGIESLTELTKDLHMYPDFHGNRSPLADPRLRGSISGLALSSSLSDLALKYHATLTAIALQTRHILETLNGAGHDVRGVYISGSQGQNTVLMQLLADACGTDVILPGDEEGKGGEAGAVGRGAAMLGRFAAEVAGRSSGELDARGQGELLWGIMVEMTPPGTLVRPSAEPREKRLLEAKYAIFRESVEVQRRWSRLMEEAARGE